MEYIGIDLGGTNIRVGGMDENENIAFEYKEPTFQNVTTSEDLYHKIKNLIKQVPNYEEAKAIGMAVAGSVNHDTKQIVTARNISILKEYPLVEKLAKEFQKPVFMENDARVAALAEAVSGRGKGKNIVCYITISTGLGGGIISNKKIYHGSHFLGGYLSRMILDGTNTSDSLISGTALCRFAKEKIDNNIKTTKELFELYKNENKVAIEIIEEFKKNLVALLLNVSCTFNPDIIVLGGGVLESKEYFLEEVKEQFKEKAHILAQNTIIDTAQYKEPGIMGACLLAKNETIKKQK